ncbi:hypothetical protein RND61_23755 [Streptomyces sp. TRM76323]|uniref:Uncharacterized protein n=1 Tax=Streptomyces tamarix TaxID=3078565 RepID=A0ABU3QQJ6_9ACTN|nr:hypothetical protein [Streptomyces tamarix]MDT9685051.1 hypothetical protein [Streptomyces tamarix]
MLALLAGLLQAAIPVGVAAAATREGGSALAASVLRAVSNGALGAAVCVVQLALLFLCLKGVRFCWYRWRGQRPKPQTA